MTSYISCCETREEWAGFELALPFPVFEGFMLCVTFVEIVQDPFLVFAAVLISIHHEGVGFLPLAIENVA